MIIERANFNKCAQLPDEPAEQFIASLHNLAADCNFEDLRNELIRDRKRNPRHFSVRMFTNGSRVNAGKAKTLVRQREAVREQQQTLQGDKIDMPGVVDAVS